MSSANLNQNYNNNTPKTILLLLVVWVLVFAVSARGQENQHQAHCDSAKICIEDYKFLKNWADFGVTCEAERTLLLDQIEKDRRRTIEMQKDLDKVYRKRKNLRVIVIGLLTGIVIESIVLFAVL